MASGWQALAELLPAKHGPDRQSIAQRLCEGDPIRQDFVMLIREHDTRPSHAALDLINQEQQTELIAERAQRFEEAIGRKANAAFSLDWFNDHAGGFGAHRLADGGDITVGNVEKTRRKRLETLVVFRLSGRGNGGERPSVE